MSRAATRRFPLIIATALAVVACLVLSIIAMNDDDAPERDLDEQTAAVVEGEERGARRVLARSSMTAAAQPIVPPTRVVTVDRQGAKLSACELFWISPTKQYLSQLGSAPVGTTDKNGVFEFEDESSIERNRGRSLLLRLDGYCLEELAQVTPGSEYQVTLTRTARLEVTSKDHLGRPVDGALVRASQIELPWTADGGAQSIQSAGVAAVFSSRTDELGKCVLHVRPGGYFLEYWHDDYIASTTKSVLVADDEAVTLRGHPILAAVVEWEGGKPDAVRFGHRRNTKADRFMLARAMAAVRQRLSSAHPAARVVVFAPPADAVSEVPVRMRFSVQIGAEVVEGLEVLATAPSQIKAPQTIALPRNPKKGEEVEERQVAAVLIDSNNRVLGSTVSDSESLPSIRLTSTNRRRFGRPLVKDLRYSQEIPVGEYEITSTWAPLRNAIRGRQVTVREGDSPQQIDVELPGAWFFVNFVLPEGWQSAPRLEAELHGGWRSPLTLRFPFDSPLLLPAGSYAIEFAGRGIPTFVQRFVLSPSDEGHRVDLELALE